MGSMLRYIAAPWIRHGIHNYFRTLRVSTMIQTFSNLKHPQALILESISMLSSHTGRQVGCWIISGQSSKSYLMPSHCWAHICFSDMAMYLFSLLGFSETHMAIQPIMYHKIGNQPNPQPKHGECTSQGTSFVFGCFWTPKWWKRRWKR